MGQSDPRESGQANIQAADWSASKIREMASQPGGSRGKGSPNGCAHQGYFLDSFLHEMDDFLLAPVRVMQPND